MSHEINLDRKLVSDQGSPIPKVGEKIYWRFKAGPFQCARVVNYEEQAFGLMIRLERPQDTKVPCLDEIEWKTSSTGSINTWDSKENAACRAKRRTA